MKRQLFYLYLIFSLGSCTPLGPQLHQQTTRSHKRQWSNLNTLATPGRQWEYLPLGHSRWDRQKLRRAQWVFDSIGATGLVVVHRGRVVVAWGDVTSPVNCHSVRKSFMSALFGIYKTKGLINPAKTLKELNISDITPLTAKEQTATV